MVGTFVFAAEGEHAVNNLCMVGQTICIIIFDVIRSVVGVFDHDVGRCFACDVNGVEIICDLNCFLYIVWQGFHTEQVDRTIWKMKSVNCKT